MNDSLETRVIATAATFLRTEPSKLSLDSGPGEVARWDSFTHVELVAELEERFNVMFDIDDIASFMTLRDIYEAIKQRSTANG